MRFNICIISNPGQFVFDDLATSTASAMRVLGHETIITRNQIIPFVTNIIIGAHQKVDLPELPRGTIIWNTEQLIDGSWWLTDRYKTILRNNTIWDYNAANLSILKKMGVGNAHYAGIGYSKDLETITHNKDRDIDVLFYGSVSERRATILQALEEEGVELKNLYGVYGHERDEYIARSKIIINIHFFEEAYFEPIRIGPLINNKCFVVSERSCNKIDEDRMAPSIVIAKYEDLVEACKYYLNKPEERNRIAAEGYELYKKNHPQEGVLAPLLRGFGNVKVITV